MSEPADSPLATSVGQVPLDRLRTIFDGMYDGVWLVDSDGETTYANDAIASMLGTTSEEMHGHPITDYLSEESRDVAVALIDSERGIGPERVDLRFVRANGEDLWTLVAASPVSTADGTFMGSMLNVSDVIGKRAAQNQALQNQKLEAIGGFAAGISHDFNNLLTAIRGFAELAAAATAADSPIRSDLDQVIASADQAHRITSKLLAFTRRQVLTPVAVDPGQVIVDMLPILRPLLSDDIDIAFEPGSGTWILIDPVALEQILVNLAVNARDAMPRGGRLVITVDDVDGYGRPALGADAPRIEAVRIRIEDTGVGMDEPTIARIFDPFYTTKPMGKGTGLGLSTVYGLISQMNGRITVESVPGKGSTFSIVLPRLHPEGFANLPADGADGLPDAEMDEADAGVVLMVEDDEGVREFSRRVLTGAGHTLLTSANGVQALKAAAKWNGRIDVLLTDVIMPGMRGPVLVAKIREIRPDIAVIYMSGYAAETLPGLDGPGVPAAFLAKPFAADALLDVVALRIALRRKTTRDRGGESIPTTPAGQLLSAKPQQ